MNIIFYLFGTGSQSARSYRIHRWVRKNLSRIRTFGGFFESAEFKDRDILRQLRIIK